MSEEWASAGSSLIFLCFPLILIKVEEGMFFAISD